MKKIGIPVALVLAISSAAHAQTLQGYGVKAGVVIANQDFDYAEDLDFHTKNRVGFNFGVYVEWLNLPHLSLLTEAHYVQKGMIIENIVNNEFGERIGIKEFDYRVDYLSVPILVKISVNSQGFSPYLIAGPRFDFLLGYDSPGGGSLYDQFKDLDTGADIGIGLESNTEPLKILLEFRYSPDFSNAYKTDLLKVKNNSFEILIGLEL